MPRVGDMQYSPLKDYFSSNVITQSPEHDVIDLYTVGASEENDTIT